jgi:hypothetical protein
MPHRPDRKREYMREYMQRKRGNVTPAVNTLAVSRVIEPGPCA